MKFSTGKSFINLLIYYIIINIYMVNSRDFTEEGLGKVLQKANRKSTVLLTANDSLPERF